MTIAPTDLAWAAGFIDGEGCIRSVIYKGKKYAVHCRIHLSISQAEPELLYKFKSIFCGWGSVNGPYANSGKGVYHFSLTGNKAEQVMELVWPYLGSRKRQDYNQAIYKYNEHYSTKGGS